MAEIECESCAVTGIKTPATGHSNNPEWSGYDLCDECIAEYDSRQPINTATVTGNIMELSTFKCLRCGWEWVPRVPTPKTCPKCRSPYWDRPRKMK